MGVEWTNESGQFGPPSIIAAKQLEAAILECV